MLSSRYIDEMNTYPELGEKIPKKVFFCAKCMVELHEIRKMQASCSTCSRAGSITTYRCPMCGITKKQFEHDPNEQPLCFGCP